MGGKESPNAVLYRRGLLLPIHITSYWSMSKLNGTIEMLQAINGRIAMIPFTLRLVPQVVSPGGHAKTVYVLQLDVEGLKVQDLLNAPIAPSMLPPNDVEPIPQDEVPTDLYPANTLVDDAPVITTDTVHSEKLDDLSDYKDVGVLANLEIRSGKDRQFAKLTLAMADSGEAFSAVTDNPKILNLLKGLQEGAMLKVHSTQASGLSFPYITDLAVVS